MKRSPVVLDMRDFFLYAFFYTTARSFFNNFREDHETMHQRDLQKLEGVLSPSHLEVSCSSSFPKIIIQFVTFRLLLNNLYFCISFGLTPCSGDGVCPHFKAEQSEHQDLSGIEEYFFKV